MSKIGEVDGKRYPVSKEGDEIREMKYMGKDTC